METSVMQRISHANVAARTTRSVHLSRGKAAQDSSDETSPGPEGKQEAGLGARDGDDRRQHGIQQAAAGDCGGGLGCEAGQEGIGHQSSSQGCWNVEGTQDPGLTVPHHRVPCSTSKGGFQEASPK